MKGALGLVLGLALGTAAFGQQTHSEVCDLYFAQGIQLRDVPSARTKAEKQRGLADKDEAGQGLLFVFEPPERVAFWMRGTRIPLSIAFLSESGAIFLIEDMQPETDDYHLSMRPTSYALELPLGTFEAKGLTVGSQLQNISCRPTK